MLYPNRKIKLGVLCLAHSECIVLVLALAFQTTVALKAPQVSCLSLGTTTLGNRSVSGNSSWMSTVSGFGKVSEGKVGGFCVFCYSVGRDVHSVVLSPYLTYRYNIDIFS